jgi:hypothetical protein
VAAMIARVRRPTIVRSLDRRTAMSRFKREGLYGHLSPPCLGVNVFRPKGDFDAGWESFVTSEASDGRKKALLVAFDS